ncbi:uncharacterized protein LOC120648713 [Panicum virgatum]|uniref:Uncharacterized protein n=1 Tax=Panicum virgatum TaxID=38727 RepID=A0A8T0NS86_PANVG|nr:uncharacterized protein LOC120648713 [Panicum virgatum]KAG2550094.1 hypothetical protein PVAP13_9KG240300 [Panicum virgatum]KAG2550096.1 hypothetical protein PVAP13_9KG240300 [Panicum virgatum]KAG2550097.1 hypothetical protein PVAP13_9KG240300 [Panicum virgatum]
MRSQQGQASHRPWCCRIPPTRKTLRSLYAPPPLRNVAPPPPVTLPFGTSNDLPGALRAYSSRVAPCSPATLQPRLYPCVHPLIGSGTQVRSTLCVAAQIAEADQIAIVSLPAKFRPSRGPPLPDQSSTTMMTPSSRQTLFAGPLVVPSSPATAAHSAAAAKPLRSIVVTREHLEGTQFESCEDEEL